MKYKISQQARCAVIGSGSWGTALVKVLLENERSVAWYVNELDVLESLRKHGRNSRYLSDVHFDRKRLSLSDDINEVVRNADMLLLVVPSAFLKIVLEPLTESLSGKFILSAIKGIVPGELVTVAEYMNRHYGVPFDRLGIAVGPTHAEEVALERLSYLTIGCKSIENAQTIRRKLETEYFHIIHSTDIYGIEYAGIIKNIYAIAVGIAVELGYGDNFIAVLIANAARELDRFLSATYPAERETNASAYLGDLLVTSYSQFSRNRTFGMMLGKGYPVENILMERNQVAEGYYASACIHEINKRFGIEMPIADAIHHIIYEGAHPGKTMRKLTQKLI